MPAPKSFGCDRGLQTRIAITVLLLGLLYVVLIAVLVAVGVGAIAIAVIVGILFLVQYLASDSVALAALGAHPVNAEQAPELHAVVERLCVEADLPLPRIAVVETTMPNAFAVGRAPSRAVVCATTGLLERLDPDELEAVLAHELAHVANRDVMVMTIAGFFASIAAFIARMGPWLGPGTDDDEDGPSFFLVVIVSGLVYVVSYVLIQALSRYRELSADRGAAIITGRPSALASALVKISEDVERIPQRDLREASGELAAFSIVPPDVKATVATLFSTHPTLKTRLDALARLERQLQGTA